VQYGAYPLDFMAFVNSDWRWTGHRFCDPARSEQDYSSDAWWYDTVCPIAVVCKIR